MWTITQALQYLFILQNVEKHIKPGGLHDQAEPRKDAWYGFDVPNRYQKN